MGIMMTKALNVDILHNFTPLNALSDQRLKDVLSDCHVESFSAGNVISHYGDCDDKALFLLSGQVVLKDHQGNETILSALDPAANHALTPSKPRQFTITAVKTANILAVNQQRLNDALLWQQSLSSLAKTLFAHLPDAIDKDWLLRLLQSRIFYRLPPMNILELLNVLTEVPVVKGQTIIRTNEEADCCYFIKEGRVEVRQKMVGEMCTVAYLSKGDFFGEEGLLKDAPRNADVTMLDDGVLMKLVKNDFDRLLKSPSLQTISFALAIPQIKSEEAVWLDVRLIEEYQLTHLKNAIHLALPDIRLKARQLALNKHYIICCDNGQRSAAAAFLLGIQGYNTTILAGGLWSLSAQERAQYLESA